MIHPNPSESRNARGTVARTGAGRIDWAPAYLAALEQSGGGYIQAAKAAKIAYSSVWERRKADPQFAADEEAAIRRAVQVLESEVVRRAFHGVVRYRFEPKTGKRFKELVYSDPLLLRLLERREPAWRQKQPPIEPTPPQGCFATRAERKAKLEEVRAEMAADRA